MTVAEEKSSEPDDELGVVHSRADVAKYFGCNEHTVSAWQRRDGFPGRPAVPGKRNGSYPLGKIEEWLKENVWKNDPANRRGLAENDELRQGRCNLLSIQVRERELRLAEKQSELISFSEVEAFIGRVVNSARASLDELPDRVLSHIPEAALTEDGRRAVREELTALVDEVQYALGELCRGDQDDEPLGADLDDGVEAAGADQGS